jgi:hypothetical protein
MEWLSENWLWLLIAVLFIVMHMFGHGGHGGHGGPGKQDDYGDEDRKRKNQGPDSGHGHH